MIRNQRRENYKVWHDMDVEDAKKEGIEKGIKRGIEKGIEKGMDVGKQEQLIELLSFKYPNENHEWVRECTTDELKNMVTIILKDLSYDDFKLLVLKNKT